MQVESLGWEKGTATHSSILAWRIPWTEECAGLPSTGYVSQGQTRLKQPSMHASRQVITVSKKRKSNTTEISSMEQLLFIIPLIQIFMNIFENL